MIAISGVLSRRQFLFSLFALPPATAIAKPVKQSSVKSPSPFPGVCQPEFWFGEKVHFCWVNELSSEQHSEIGEVVGVLWNSPGNRWEYQITWLSSTAYPPEDYPIFDNSVWAANVLSKVNT